MTPAACAPIPRAKEKVFSGETTEYNLVFENEFPITKRVNKQLCFLVVDADGGNEFWSIDEFLCYGVFTEENVCDWINYKNEVASKFPNVKRRCLMCNRFALKGKTICFSDHKCQGVKAQDFIY